MSHPRRDIRAAVADLLTNATAAGARVFRTRTTPYRRLESPAISVYTRSESVDPASKSTAPRELTRTLMLAVEVAVKMGGAVDDTLDDIAIAIERAIDADPTFGGVCSDSILSSTDIGVDEAGDKPIGMMVLTYAVTYFTDAPSAADVTLDDLKTVDVKTSLGGQVHPGNQAEDKIENLDLVGS